MKSFLLQNCSCSYHQNPQLVFWLMSFKYSEAVAQEFMIDLQVINQIMHQTNIKIICQKRGQFSLILKEVNANKIACDIIFLFPMISTKQAESEYVLNMKTVTWQKDSHSLFDYEFNKNVIQNTCEFQLTDKVVYMYRNNQTSEVNFIQQQNISNKIQPNLQFLGAFQLKEQNKKSRIQFYCASDIRKLNVSRGIVSEFSSESKQEDIYLIVRSLKTKNNQNKGYKLSPGQIIKFGRVQYLVSSINNSGNNKEMKSKFWMNDKRIVVTSLPLEASQPLECKYCMLGEGTQSGQFLCTPCKCSGTCGLVHFKCLQKWNQSKVKKEVVGGTIQYNFQKFYCEVCKEQYPRFIQKDGVDFELMQIQKPVGPHLMLEGVSEKANNMMVIQNIPQDGIKIGRGHQCEIRVTDISVSRNHAKISKINEDYYIFDNKSKFGTLVKEQSLNLQLSKIKQGIQIGRTVITFEKAKKI